MTALPAPAMPQARPVVAFDHHSRDYALNWRKIDRDLRENTPVAWSDAHGGFWILSRYNDIVRACQDWKTFTSENDISGAGNGGHGILIPRNPFQFALSESDPPQSTSIRKLETASLNAESVSRWESQAREFAERTLAPALAAGQIEFAMGLCMPVAAKTVMKVVGVPLADWEVFAYSAHEMSHIPTTHPDFPYDKIALVQGLILELARERRREPKNDIVSALMHGTVFHGGPMTDEMAVGVISALVFGGFDTSSTAMLNMLLYLNGKPELRQLLLADNSKMRAAIEETLRLTPSGNMLARTVTRDCEVGGYTLHAGERVMFLWSAANRDPAKFERPDDFWLERPNAGAHLTFGFGLHRCLGSILAKMVISVVLETVLRDIGDYRIDESLVERYETIGGVNGFVKMPASFTPRPPQTAV